MPSPRPQPARRGTRKASGRAQPDELRLLRSSDDQLSVAWPAVAGVSRWQVVCWDRGDRPVARLTLAGKHRRATFAGLRGFESPFTIGVSGFDNEDRVLWQAGLGELALRKPPERDGASSSHREPR